MEKPIRIQLKRTKGWRKPPNTLVVTRATEWGNPFTLAQSRTLHPHESEDQHRARVIAAFKEYCSDPEMIIAIRNNLRGKNLACVCPLDKPCHADVLLEIANSLGGKS